MDLHSVALFTQPITFLDGDALVEGKNWEFVFIPDYVYSAMLEVIMPSESKKFQESEQDMAQAKKRWLDELKSQGFSAVNIKTRDGNIFAEATKDVLKICSEGA